MTETNQIKRAKNIPQSQNTKLTKPQTVLQLNQGQHIRSLNAPTLATNRGGINKPSTADEKKLKTKLVPPSTITISPKSVVRKSDPLHTLPSASTRSLTAKRNVSKQDSSTTETVRLPEALSTIPLPATPKPMWTTPTEALSNPPDSLALPLSKNSPKLANLLAGLETPVPSKPQTPSTDGINNSDGDRISSLEKIISAKKEPKSAKKKFVRKQKLRNSSPKSSFFEDTSSNSNHSSTCSLSHLPANSESHPTSLFSEFLSRIPSPQNQKGKITIPLELDVVLKLIPQVC